MNCSRTLGTALNATALGLSIVLMAPASHAASSAAAPQDMGVSAAATSFTVSIILKVRDPEDLDEFIANSVDPESPRYHRFLTTEQFRNRFAPPTGQIKRVTAYLESLGITVNEVYTNNLVIKATGTSGQFSQAFTTTMRKYRDSEGREFDRPDSEVRVPSQLQDLILYVAGLNTQTAQFRPHSTNSHRLSGKLGQGAPQVVLPSGNSAATGVPGSYTTGDVANFYGVNALYKRGVAGQGRTIGIATLADFLPSDAYYYWNAIGLKVDANRISKVRVDGGGELSGAAGSGETTLDVQQSGGLAPAAKIVVYDAPNTEAGFIDVFYKAAADNLVDTLSVSWGSPEILNFNIPGVSTDSTGVLVAYHQAFAEAAAQGISTFAASGDSGAYDTNRGFAYPNFSKILAVDTPASDPYIIAAGGTTVPVNLQFKTRSGPFAIDVPTEQAWGWDYLTPLLVALYGPDCTVTIGIACGDAEFAVGGGGGVSVFWKLPDYQKGVKGIHRSEPNQVWTYSDLAPKPNIQYLYTVPANFNGRNLPDLSLNSDPETGYLIYSTPDGGWQAGYGGTSFASPQLNGIFALIGQVKSSRLGLLHPQLYNLSGKEGRSTKGLIDIKAGDNWFYSGVAGYDLGTGLGVINAESLAEAFR